MSLIATPTQSTLTAVTAPAPANDAEALEFEIKPAKGWVAIDWKELIHYRELLYFLIWRDVKVRYKQTVLGASWAIIQPLTNMLLMTFVFSTIAGLKLPDELALRNIPYSVFIYAGLLPWTYFSVGVGGGGTSLLNQQNLLTKVYFPRLFVPASTIGAALVDTLISFGVLAAIMACYRIVPPWTVIFVPFLVVLTTLAALGIAFTLSSLTVTYRDFRFLIPFMVGCWQWLSPVAYSLYFPKKPWLNWLFRLNPMYGIINAYRSALLGQHWDLAGLGMAIIETGVLLFFGLFYFKKTERRFADIA